MAQTKVVFSEEERYGEMVNSTAKCESRKGFSDSKKTEYLRRKENVKVCFDKWRTNLASNEVERLDFKVEYVLLSSKQIVCLDCVNRFTVLFGAQFINLSRFRP